MVRFSSPSREVFYIPEPQLIVPQLQCPISFCLLRVIDNDTGFEVPRVFSMTPPHPYKPNKVPFPGPPVVSNVFSITM